MTKTQKNNLIESNGSAVTEQDFKMWIAKNTEKCADWAAAGDAGTIADELNPAYLFSTTATDLLAKICSGEVSAIFMAQRELANRGLDRNGVWVGFDQAQIIHFGSK